MVHSNKSCHKVLTNLGHLALIRCNAQNRSVCQPPRLAAGFRDPGHGELTALVRDGRGVGPERSGAFRLNPSASHSEMTFLEGSPGAVRRVPGRGRPPRNSIGFR